MKKISATATSIAVALLILSSCRKFIDPHPEDPNEIGKYCPIGTLAFDTDDPNKFINVSYNADGNPISMMTRVPIYDLYHNYIFFKYDKHGRLINYSNYPPGGTFPDFEQRFSYPGPRIIVDSIFNSEFHTVVMLLRHTLDEKGRIVKTFAKYYPEPAAYESTIITTYDSRGNKVIPGVVYDDKINVYRTSRTWQLFFQDFSMNNPIAPANNGYPASILAYNELGLPTHYQAEPTMPYINIFFYYNAFDVKVTYNCTAPSGTHHNLIPESPAP
ncbi:MAG TPA: hypothetical protein VI233_10795 [Puia sp.]